MYILWQVCTWLITSSAYINIISSFDTDVLAANSKMISINLRKIYFFQINQVFDLNSSLYNYVALSEEKNILEVDDFDIKEIIVNFGKINLQKKELIPNSLIIWYKICIDASNECETKRNNSFMNHSAVIFETKMQEKVMQEKDIYIKFQKMYNLIRITLE